MAQSQIAFVKAILDNDNILSEARRLYSTPTKPLRKNEDGSEEDRKSVLDFLQDLVPSSTQKQKSREGATWEGQQEQEEEQSRASFAPEFRRYIQETPTDRWRERQILGVRSRVGHALRDEAGHYPKPSIRRSLQSEAEVAWKRGHIASLLPPYHEREEYQEYRKPSYTRKGMRNWAQLLTTPTADTHGTTVLLHFDNKRYLIGSLAEGTQRACVQMGARLLKVQECFLTGKVEWSNTGGLIGMILTLADAAQSSRESSVEDAAGRAVQKARRMKLEEGGSEMREMVEKAKREVREARLTVFGPENLNHAMATARRFVFRKGMPVDLHEVREGMSAGKTEGEKGAREEVEDEWAPYWADENIKVWPMSISPAASRPVTSNGVGSVSPRKRSIDEVYMDERANTSAPNGALKISTVEPAQLSQADKDDLTRKAVVNEMFNSSWRLDALYETPLSQVKLPATIFVRNRETKKVEKYRGPLPGSSKETPDPDMTVLVRQPWPGALVESLPPTQPSRVAMSYIVKNHIQRGKFHPERAKECKVEKGQKWSQLQKGESVQNADGETITPEMVLGEPKEGGGIAVVALPDKSYVEPLLARPEWRQEKIMNGVGAVVWSCGEGVAADERIQNFMREFKDVKHIVSSPEYCPNEISLESVTASTIRLGKVDPGRYKVPIHQQDAVARASLPENAEVAQRGMVFQTEPKLELQRNQIPPPFSIAEVEKEMPAEVLEMASQAQNSLADSAQDPAISAWKEGIPNQDAEITTLGTGSALPSKYRNVSSTLVRVPGWGNILLDAGENTIGQLKRVFTADEMKQILRDLRILFISHMHADHHLGTVGVLKAWYREVHSAQPLPPDSSAPVQDLLGPDQPQRLAVISEPAMQQWLTEYAHIEDFGLSRLTPLVISPPDPQRNKTSKLNWFIPPSQLADCSRAEVDARMEANTIPPSLIGLTDAQAVLVQHCHGARAVSLTLPSGFKVSYSGDCRPSKNFVHIGQGSTVVIHESTFDDELAGDAQAKNHSTMSEALGVAQGMRAKACVLTHFSQRYQKMPVLEYGGAGEEPPAPSILEDVDEGGDPERAGDDVAQTFPDQSTSNGAGAPSTSNYMPFSGNEQPSAATTSAGPAPVRFKLSSDMKVAVAFDYMRVRVGEMWQMEKFTPALLKLFEEEEAKKLKDGVEEKGGSGGGGGSGGKKEKAGKVKGKKSRESMR